MSLDWTFDRLRELRKEYEDGHARLATLEDERQQARDSLLQISGAIQVLEDLIERAEVFAEPKISVS